MMIVPAGSSQEAWRMSSSRCLMKRWRASSQAKKVCQVLGLLPGEQGEWRPPPLGEDGNAVPVLLRSQLASPTRRPRRTARRT